GLDFGFLLSEGIYTCLAFTACGHAPSTHPIGINDAGQIVGTLGPSIPENPFLLSDGMFSCLPPGCFFNGTSANGINDNGQIVGFSFVNPVVPLGHGFLFSDGIYTNINFPGAGFTSANGINDAGQIVGRHDRSGFLLSGGTYTNIDFPGASSTSANGI